MQGQAWPARGGRRGRGPAGAACRLAASPWPRRARVARCRGGAPADAAPLAHQSLPPTPRALCRSWLQASDLQKWSIELLGEAGILLVAAAGNDYVNMDVAANPRFYPAAFSTTLGNVISVAASDSADKLALYAVVNGVQTGALAG